MKYAKVGYIITGHVFIPIESESYDEVDCNSLLDAENEVVYMEPATLIDADSRAEAEPTTIEVVEIPPNKAKYANVINVFGLPLT